MNTLILFQHPDLLLEAFIIVFGFWLLTYLLKTLRRTTNIWIYFIPVFFILIGSMVMFVSVLKLFPNLL
ncbi:hypothetical protein MUY27_08485 [Mucilaginibacter sp. RS28]|uniref:Uncharacterized protein n=1 Tax=Mucilaginibacter straminoryzae TaxID=2932774 RepID=A0A9X2B8L6_9SPHI|nr:hypothetical protein [Mucilaginibacter straminoryzae]MCJ8209744.1 hypothetical protein [Mucilaginibacter straminoryzae]